MVKRKQLGLIFSYNENWIGGTYYILNIIHALNLLEDNLKPQITIISERRRNFDFVKTETNYPNLAFLKFKHRSCSSLLCKIIYYIQDNIIKKGKLIRNFDMVFPYCKLPGIDFLESSKCYWIPDFQEVHLPFFFTKDEILERKINQITIAVKGERLILSSIDAKNNYLSLYPFSNPYILVLPFAVTHSDFKLILFNELKSKYNIPENYFYCPNQFWIHKNHIVVLESLKLLKKKNTDIKVLFSGKESDSRAPKLIDDLKLYVKDNNLTENVFFLGFIERNDMLNIMHYSQAVIQPSLSEGWSTVNEDAKRLNKFVIASDLNVHKEQLKRNRSFFIRDNSNDLAEIITGFINNPPEISIDDYQKNVKKTGEMFSNFI